MINLSLTGYIEENINLNSDIEKVFTPDGIRPLAIQCTWNVATGTPSLDIAISNDGQNYKSLLQAPVTMSSIGHELLVEQLTPYKYLKISVNSGGATGMFGIYINK